MCSPTTPPGTKVKLVGKVAVQNGFLLLKQTSLEVLGGTVEALYKKWVSQKVYSNILTSKLHLITVILLRIIVGYGQSGEE